MGYDTRFMLSSDANPDDFELRDKIIYELEKKSGYQYWYIGHTFDEGKIINNDISWYKYMEDMEIISMKFPELVFKLEGDGHDKGDIWIAYFKDGASVKYKAIITFPPFSVGDLT